MAVNGKVKIIQIPSVFQNIFLFSSGESNAKGFGMTQGLVNSDRILSKWLIL